MTNYVLVINGNDNFQIEITQDNFGHWNVLMSVFVKRICTIKIN